MQRTAPLPHATDIAPFRPDDLAVVVDGGAVFAIPPQDMAASQTSSGVLLYSGSTLISSASVLSGVPVGANETEYLLGGLTSDTEVTNGGFQIVSSGGMAIATTLAAGGEQIVSSAGVAQSTIVESGGLLAVDGGTASDVVIDSGGSAAVDQGSIGNAIVSGGSLSIYTAETGDLLIEAGGEVLAEGSVASVTVSSGGLLTLLGGAAEVTVANGGGVAVQIGAIGDLTIGSGGFAVLQSDAASASTGVVDAGGTLILLPGATASGVTVQEGGDVVSTGVVVISGASLIAVSPVVDGISVGQGASAYVLSGGSASLLTVSDGRLTVYAGGTADSASLYTSSYSYLGTEEVKSGGYDSATTVGPKALQIIDVGGSGAGQTVLSGGYQTVDGVAANVEVFSGGSQQVYGLATATTVMSGGFIGVGAHGITSGAVLLGGSETAGYGGHADATRIGSGGVLLLYSGSAEGTDVQAGGEEYVFVQGSASGTLIESSGVQIVKAPGGGFHNEGGVALNATVMSGGLQVLQSLYEGFRGSGVERGTLIEAGGTIDVASQPFGSGATAGFNAAADTLTLSDGGMQTTLQLSGDYTGEYFALSNDGTGGTDVVVVEGTPCYCRGTSILTTTGEVAVEHLAIGDQLITLNGTAQRLRWIGRRAYDGRFAAGNRDVLPILFRAGALGLNIPHRDLTVSPLHAMYLDGVLVPAACLVNSQTIVQIQSVDRVEYFHLELDHHGVIFAEGAAAESYLDDANRGMFHNAAEYAALYPGARPSSTYCAPRVEHGDALEAIRRRLDPTPAPAATKLQGHLDLATRTRIAGWAMQADGAPVRLRIVANGVVRAEVTADRPRPDVGDSVGGDGACGFDVTIDGGFDPAIRHLIQVQRVGDGQELPRSPQLLQPEHVVAAPDPNPLRGYLDAATRTEIRGWAQAGAHAVDLQILDNGIPVGRVIANRRRGDLAAAELGDGRCAFIFRFPAPLSPIIRHAIEVRRASDGAAIDNSPILIEHAHTFDTALQTAVAYAVAASDGADQHRVIDFLRAQIDHIEQRQADTHIPQAPTNQPRALVIDSQLPAPDRDAGSHAILSHMHALQGLGYTVSFVAADQMHGATGALTTAGITLCAAPLYASVEDVLRRHASRFDLVYLHRAEIAAAYLALARRWQPHARMLYAIADLHHLRLARQAQIEQRPELRAASHRMRLAECTAAWQADAVITHSPHEAALLRAAVPRASVHVVPWAVPARPTAVSFARRRHLAFIANYAHAPNTDAARWLIEAVMPLVWQTDATIACHLAGGAMPPALRALASARVRIAGHVPDLATLFDQVRLTVAPLRFGAGIKGKVLESLAAGIPCAMTPIAAEGLPLTPGLARLTGTTAAALAAVILRLHGDAAANRAAARAGLALIARANTPGAVQAALAPAVQPAGTGRAAQTHQAS